MKAVLCPVCGGSGEYMGKTCHGCNRKGWVEVHEDPKPELSDRWVRWYIPDDLTAPGPSWTGTTWPADFEHCRRVNCIRRVKL